MKNLILILLLVGAPGVASCMSESDRPLPQIFEQSKLVIFADIVSVRGQCEAGSGPCRAGFIYELLPRKIIKGNAVVDKAIMVCSLSTIQLDTSYVLFIEPATQWNSRENCEYSSAIDSDGVFRHIGSDYYRLGSPMSQMIVHRYGQTFYSNAILAPNFEKDLTALSESVKEDTAN